MYCTVLRETECICYLQQSILVVSLGHDLVPPAGNQPNVGAKRDRTATEVVAKFHVAENKGKNSVTKRLDFQRLERLWLTH